MSNSPKGLSGLEPACTNYALVPRGEYHLTIMNDTGLVSRLAGELKDVAHEYELTWPEFKRDPIGFIKRSAVGYGQMAARSFGNRNAMIAISVAVVALLSLVGRHSGCWIDRNRAGASRAGISCLFSSCVSDSGRYVCDLAGA